MKSIVRERVGKPALDPLLQGEEHIGIQTTVDRRDHLFGEQLELQVESPLGPSLRDPSLEADLQARLDDGHRIFVLGDIHGHLATFRALLHRLNLKPEDRVVCLGDMIDRGPNSAGLVHLLRTHPQVICLKGNHEHMAIQCVQPDGSFEAWQPWMQRGGKSTYASYIVQANGDLYEAKRQMAEDFMWLDTLPTQIVLDHLRFVHAGYDPRMPLDMQGEKELLWIRKEWFQHEGAVDPARTVFFGHTTTTKLGDAGEVAFSDDRLPDGRPAWVGLDVGAYNHVAPGLAAVEAITFRCVKQPTLRCDRWFERIDTRTKKKGKGKKRAWKGEENLRESEVARSFGLKAWPHEPNPPAPPPFERSVNWNERVWSFPNILMRSPPVGTACTEKRRKNAFGAIRGPTSFRVYRQRSQPTWHHGPSDRLRAV